MAATRNLLEAVLAGANDTEIEGVEVRALPAMEATADDVLAAHGYVLGTPANFGNLARRMHCDQTVSVVP